MLCRLIEERLIRVDERTFDPSRATDKEYDGVPRIKTDSIASFICRVLTWYWDDRKGIREKRIERQLRNLTSDVCSLTKELQELKSILCTRDEESTALSIEFAEEVKLLG